MITRTLVARVAWHPFSLSVALTLLFIGGMSLMTVRAQSNTPTDTPPSFDLRRPFGVTANTSQYQSVWAGLMVAGSTTTPAIIVGANNGQNKLYLKKNAQEFEARQFGGGNDQTTDIVAMDMNSDGNTDIIAGNNGTRSLIYLNDGKNNFYDRAVDCDQPQQEVHCIGADINTTSLAAGDVNNDGCPDIVVGTDNGQVKLYLNGKNSGNNNAEQCTAQFNMVKKQIDLKEDNEEGKVSKVILQNIYKDAPGSGVRKNKLDLIAAVVIVNNSNVKGRTKVFENNGSDIYADGATEDEEFYEGAITGLAATSRIKKQNTQPDKVENYRPPLIAVAVDGSKSKLYKWTITEKGRNEGGKTVVEFITEPDPGSDINFGSASDNTRGVALAELNGDGRYDIIAANNNIASKVYIQKETGTVDSCPTAEGGASNLCYPIPQTSNARSVVVGNIYQMSSADIVLVGDGFRTVFYNNIPKSTNPIQPGDIKFSRQPLENEGKTRSTVNGDIDGDFDLDLIVAKEDGQSGYFLNDGSGGFAPMKPFGALADPTTSIAVADFNGDSRLDIVAGKRGQQGALYLQADDGSFSIQNCKDSSLDKRSIRCFGASNDTVISIAVGDLNGDGFFDIVTGSYNDYGKVYLNDGRNNFPNGVSFGFENAIITGLALADMNSDGKLDIVAARSANGVRSVVYLQKIPTTANSNPFYSGLTLCDDEHIQQIRCIGPGTQTDILDAKSVVVGDLNGDKRLDIVLGQGLGNSQAFLNASGFFSAAAILSFPASNSIALGDLDGDRRLDITAGVITQPLTDSLIQPTYYRNTASIGGRPTLSTGLNVGKPVNESLAVAAADFNGDGALDLAIAPEVGQGQVYLNDGVGRLPVPTLPREDIAVGSHAQSFALGDLNNDGRLDLITASHYSLNTSGGSFGSPVAYHSGNDGLVVLGDIDNDRLLDVLRAENGQIITYKNTGNPILIQTEVSGQPGANTSSLALGDLDSDGWLDLVVANNGGDSLIYLNDRSGRFSSTPAQTRILKADEVGNRVSSIVLADINSDGALDIVVGKTYDPQSATAQQSLVYRNDGAANFAKDAPFGGEREQVTQVVVADANQDGRPDIIAGYQGKPTVVYLQQYDGTFYAAEVDCIVPHSTVRCIGDDQASASSLALVEFNGDDTLDIVVGTDKSGSAVYLGDGQGNFRARRALSDTSMFGNLAVGDINQDGASDIMAGSNVGIKLILNGRSGIAAIAQRQANSPPQVYIPRPTKPEANFFSSGALSDTTILTIPFYLADADGDPVREVTGTYSLDGGATWKTAIASQAQANTTRQSLKNLVANCLPPGCRHTFLWDTFTSGFFGQSDSIIFRIKASEAVSSTTTSSGTAGQYQRPFAVGQTLPFRARGTQIRVVEAGIPLTTPPKIGSCPQQTTPCRIWLPHMTQRFSLGGSPENSNARVYLLKKGASRGGLLLGPGNGRPYRTTSDGYVQGRGVLGIGDQLVALLPKAETEKYVLYYSSAPTATTGLKFTEVRAAGVQTLTVSAQRPLMLFKLRVALEWDARADEDYTRRLIRYLERTSELIFSWTSGQAALGEITLSLDGKDTQNWKDADVRIYASNRIRPNATQGGVVAQQTTDPLVPKVTYRPGVVRMGPTWNRYGDSGTDLGEDWPRALAHELGHYLFFLDDNYLGLDRDGVLISIPENPNKTADCPGPMTNPYDEDYDTFHPLAGWQQNSTCGRTLAQQETGRADWATIRTFYPWLRAPTSSYFDIPAGPTSLPINVTQIISATETPTSTIRASVSLTLLDAKTNLRVVPGRNTRAYVFRPQVSDGQKLLDLGRPSFDTVLARGVQNGDRVCVYEPSSQARQAAMRRGCVDLAPAGDDSIKLVTLDNWQPEIIIIPGGAAVRTINVIVPIAATGPTTPTVLGAELYSVTNKRYTTTLRYNAALASFTGSFTIPQNDGPPVTGYLRVWVPAPEIMYEVVTDYALGGGPALKLGSGDRDANILAHNAPAVSSDGQAMLFAKDLDFADDEIFSLQASIALPQVPPWVTPVGRGYWLNASKSLNQFPDLSIGFQYLGREAPAGQEQWLKIYYWDGKIWTPLDETRLSTYYNIATVRVRGAGLYALMASVDRKLTKGENLISYPITQNRPVREALVSIEGKYNSVYTYDPTDPNGPWLYFDPKKSDAENGLKELKTNYGYWIHMREDAVLRLKGPDNLDALAVSSQAQLLNGLPGSHILPAPPATFYGSVMPGSMVALREGMAIVAQIGGVTCGQGTLRLARQGFTFELHVEAASERDPGCGTPGSEVQFLIDGHLLQPVAHWQSGWPAQVLLRP